MLPGLKVKTLVLAVVRRLTIYMDPYLRVIKGTSKIPKTTLVLWNATDCEDFAISTA